jgi:secreted trypsin-like serine protease
VISGTNEIVGVVSFGGPHCADPDVPGVYARVASVVAWIKVFTLKDKNLNP